MTGTLKGVAVKAARKIKPLRKAIDRRAFGTSGAFWDKRYRLGGDSGEGSYGRLAEFKAEFLNAYVAEHSITSVIEFGVGDGAQLERAVYPSFVGLDVSPTAIEWCKAKFAGDPTKSFAVHDATKDALPAPCELSMSLDVIYHTTEDDVFHAYMEQLFDAATRAVIVYASNFDRVDATHVRHRKFTDWVERHRPDWELVRVTPNRYPEALDDGGETSFADFYVFERAA